MRIRGWVDNNIYPPTFGGSMRAFHLLRNLAREAEVSVVCAVKRRDRSPRTENVDGLQLHRIKPYHPAVFHYLERLRIAPLFLAHGVYGRWPGRLLPPESREADVWQIDSIALTSLFSHAPSGTLKVYSSQNVEAEWFERVGAPLLARRQWGKRLEAIERAAVERADLVLAVSHQDREGFLARYRLADEKVHVVENGFDDEGLRAPTPEEKRRARRDLGLEEGCQLLFAGSDFPHNRRAVDDLFQHLVGKLAQLDARLLVVGEIAERYQSRARQEGGGRVRCLPARPDLLPVLWAADVGLNPVTTGAGSNVKLPTYLGAGLPVLSTPFGMRGYEKLRGFVSEAPVEDFADRLAGGLHYEPALAGPLAEYSWRSLGGRVGRLYREWISSRRSDPGGRSGPKRPGEARCAS